jgi:hypothetical protein
VTERLFLFSKYFSQNGENIKSWAFYLHFWGASLVSFLCSWTEIICLCLSYVVVVVASLCNHLISSPLFLGRSCVPLLLCGFVTRKKELAPPQGTLLCFFPNSTLHSFSLNVVWLACLTPLSCASLHLNRFYAISESLSFFRRPYIGVIDRKCRGFDRSEM